MHSESENRQESSPHRHSEDGALPQSHKENSDNQHRRRRLRKLTATDSSSDDTKQHQSKASGKTQRRLCQPTEKSQCRSDSDGETGERFLASHGSGSLSYDSCTSDSVESVSSKSPREELQPHSSQEDSFNVYIEPVPVFQRTRRVRKRRKPKRQRCFGNTEEMENSQKNLNCIKLPYTEVIRSAADFIQEIFTALKEHDRYFKQHRIAAGNNNSETPNASCHERPLLDNQLHGRRSIPPPTEGNASQTEPYTGDWMTSQHANAESQTTSNRIYNSLFDHKKQNIDPSSFMNTIDCPRSRFITVFIAPDPDSACAVSLFKVCNNIIYV